MEDMTATDDLIEVYDTLREKLKVKDDVLKQISDRNEELIKCNEDSTAKIKDLMKDNSTLKTDLNVALSRLSKIAGEKMTKENPLITNLGNENRPAKIGEKWSSLYADEWTDLYEDMSRGLKNHEDLETENGDVEKKILKIVDWCYSKCTEVRRSQKDDVDKLLWDIVKTIQHPGTRPSEYTVENQVKDDSDVGFLLESMEPFKEVTAPLMSRCIKQQLETLKKIFTNDYKQVFAKNITRCETLFIEKCCELCWYMCISEPPMVLEYANCENKAIDTNRFNHYNRTGGIIEYVVWPTLLINENGPVLSKGTVQVKFEPDKQRRRLNSVDLISCQANRNHDQLRQPTDLRNPTESSTKQDTKHLPENLLQTQVLNNGAAVNNQRDSYSTIPPPSSCGGKSIMNQSESLNGNTDKETNEGHQSVDITKEAVDNKSSVVADKCVSRSSVIDGHDDNHINKDNTDKRNQSCQYNNEEGDEKYKKQSKNGTREDKKDTERMNSNDKNKKSGTQYYVKRDIPTDRQVIHSGETLARSLTKNLSRSKLPRQLSQESEKINK